MKPMPFKAYLRRFLPHLAVDSYRAMRAVYSAALGQPLDDADLAALAPLLGGRSPPAGRVKELWTIAGRGSGKTEVASAFMGYLALCVPWKVNPGQVAAGYLIAPTTETATIAMDFFIGQLRSHAVLESEIETANRDCVQFKNGAVVEIVPADKGTVRGASLFCALVDELAFLPTMPNSANPDAEILAALRPALARMPGAMLVCISSPYAQQGALFEAFQRSYGQDDASTLVVRGGTLAFNPVHDRDEITRGLREDPERFAAEYLAEWRTDCAAFIDAALVDGCTRSEPRELPRRNATVRGTPIHYHGAVDASGGRGDAAAAAVAHLDDDGRVVVDACRRWPAPHDPAVVAKDVAAFLKGYNLTSAFADQYAAEFARTVYGAVGVALVDAPGTRSDCYLHLLPMLTQGRVELPLEPTLRMELLGLERRVRSGGRDVIDHRTRGAHDDLANATSLAAWAAARGGTGEQEIYVCESGLFDGYSDEHNAEIAYIRYNVSPW